MSMCSTRPDVDKSLGWAMFLREVVRRRGQPCYASTAELTKVWTMVFQLLVADLRSGIKDQSFAITRNYIALVPNRGPLRLSLFGRYRPSRLLPNGTQRESGGISGLPARRNTFSGPGREQGGTLGNRAPPPALLPHGDQTFDEKYSTGLGPLAIRSGAETTMWRKDRMNRYYRRLSKGPRDAGAGDLRLGSFRCLTPTGTSHHANII